MKFDGPKKVSFSTEPLFAQNSSNVWMIHVFFTVKDTQTSILSQSSMHGSSNSIGSGGNAIFKTSSLLNILPVTGLPLIDSANSDTVTTDDQNLATNSKNWSHKVNISAPIAPILAIISMAFMLSCFILAVYMTRKKKQNSRLMAKQVVAQGDNIAITSQPLYEQGDGDSMYLARTGHRPMAPLPKASALKTSSTHHSNTCSGVHSHIHYSFPQGNGSYKQPTVMFSPQITTIHDDLSEPCSLPGGHFDNSYNKFYV